MGLDFGFYRQDETEALGFRNHHDLFDMLCSRPLVQIEPYTDFYVTRPMIEAVLEEIEENMRTNGSGPSLDALPKPGTDVFSAILNAIPESFYWSEPGNTQTALLIYWILLTDLLEELKKDGCLICGWSA